LARKKWAFRASQGGVTIGKGGSIDKDDAANHNGVLPIPTRTTSINTSINNFTSATSGASLSSAVSDHLSVSNSSSTSGECIVSDVSMLSEHARFLLAPSLPHSTISSSVSSSLMSSTDSSHSTRVFMRSIGRTYHLIGQGGSGNTLGIGGSTFSSASNLGPRPLSKGQVVKMGACSMQVTDLCIQPRGSSPMHSSSSLHVNPESSSSSSSPSTQSSTNASKLASSSSLKRPIPHPGAATDLSCYICFDETDFPANRLEPSPCACSKLVHKLCLARWIETRGSRTCSICKSKLPVECTVEPPYLVMQVVRHMRGLRWDGDHEFIISFSSGTRAAQAVTIGKGSDCDVILPDPSLSRVHARVAFSNGVFTVEDMASQAGTYLRLQADEMFPLPLDRICVFKMGHTIVNVKLRKKKANSLFPMHLWTRKASDQLSNIQDAVTMSHAATAISFRQSSGIITPPLPLSIQPVTSISQNTHQQNRLQNSTGTQGLYISSPLITSATTPSAISAGASVTPSGSDRSRSRVSSSPRHRAQETATRSARGGLQTATPSAFTDRYGSVSTPVRTSDLRLSNLASQNSSPVPFLTEQNNDALIVLRSERNSNVEGVFLSPSSPSSPGGGMTMSEAGGGGGSGGGGISSPGAVITTILSANTLSSVEEEQRAAYLANILSTPSIILESDKDVAHYVEAVALAASMGQSVNPELPLLLTETDEEDEGGLASDEE
jgi:hypothetical protein